MIIQACDMRKDQKKANKEKKESEKGLKKSKLM